jgi:hypothetical protein
MTKPSSSLKKFIDVAKKDTRVLGSVERYLISKPRDKSRRTDVLHPSEMVGNDWCHRASYFQLLGKEPISNRTMSLRLASVFEEGHTIHAKWQRWFQEMGTLYGKWYCSECEEMFWGGSDCHEGPLEYREVPLFYEPLRISGHSDGWLIGLGEPLMLEIKSLGEGTLRWECPELYAENGYDFNKTWKAINAPFMKHIMQVQIYMKLAELLGYENVPQEAVIIYEAKPNQESKEFVIPKSDFGISHIFEAAQMIVDSIKANTPPVCNIGPEGCGKCKGYND